MEPTVRALRTVNGIGVKRLSIDEFAVCSPVQPRGELTEEEYAAYLEAADLKHDTYMRHCLRTPMPPAALRNVVTVNGTIVAWLPYDGVPRVIDRAFSDQHMNTIRDLARKHLGQDPDFQQRLADERGDVEKMTAEGFEHVIWALRDRAEPGKDYNAFPEGIPVREWSAMRRAEERARTGKEYPHIPHPTAQYSEDQRAAWAEWADRVEAAFRERFPAEHRLWEFQQRWESTRAERSEGPPLFVNPGNRILFEEFNRCTPAVVGDRIKARRDGWLVDLWTMPQREDDDGLKSCVFLYPSRAMHYADIPEGIRRHWDGTWAEIELNVVR